jgi:hypothetical protein
MIHPFEPQKLTVSSVLGGRDFLLLSKRIRMKLQWNSPHLCCSEPNRTTRAAPRFYRESHKRAPQSSFESRWWFAVSICYGIVARISECAIDIEEYVFILPYLTHVSCILLSDNMPKCTIERAVRAGLPFQISPQYDANDVLKSIFEFLWFTSETRFIMYCDINVFHSIPIKFMSTFVLQMNGMTKENCLKISMELSRICRRTAIHKKPTAFPGSMIKYIPRSSAHHAQFPRKACTQNRGQSLKSSPTGDVLCQLNLREIRRS